MTVDEELLTSSLRMLGDGGLDDAELDRRVSEFRDALRRLRDDPAEATRIDALAMDRTAETQGKDLNTVAAAWADSVGQQTSDLLFEAIVRAAEAELLAAARLLAHQLVGPAAADDAISRAWAKLWTGHTDRQPGGFAPGRGTFKAYFVTVLRDTCAGMLRSRAATPQPADITAGGEPAQGGLSPDAADLEDEIITRIDAVQEKITAVIEVLDLPDSRRDMLRLMLDTQIDAPAGLTPEEREAASLVRRHHSVAAAASAEPGIDIPGLYASATRKVLALFGIEAGTDLTNRGAI